MLKEYLSPREKIEYLNWKVQTLEHLLHVHRQLQLRDAAHETGLAADIEEARAILNELSTRTAGPSGNDATGTGSLEGEVSR